MSFPPEIEEKAKIFARNVYRKLGLALDQDGRYVDEDEYADATWFVFKVDATKIMAAMRARDGALRRARIAAVNSPTGGQPAGIQNKETEFV